MERLIDIPYGNACVRLDLPDRNVAFIADVANLEAKKGQYNELRRTIAHPIGSPSLVELVGSSDKITIIGDDLTRPTPCSSIIKVILDTLERKKIRMKNVKVVVALGTHRSLTKSEIQKKYGSVAEKVQVLNHEPRNKEKLTYLGHTPQGTPIWINNDVLDSDIKIGVGSIMPHNLAGWSAGAKTIQPGVSGEETTAATHLISARYDPSELLGNAENPMRREIEEVARKVGLDTILNVVVNKDRKIVQAFSGDFIKAHRAGVKIAEREYCVTFPRKVDLIIASSYPMDQDYWIAGKALVSSYLGIKKGGTIILVTPCYEGISAGGVHTDAIKKYGKLSYRELEEKVKEGKIKDGVAASIMIVLAKVKERANIAIFSENLSKEECEWIGAIKMTRMEDTLKKAFTEYGKNLEIGVLNHCEVVLREK